MGAARLAAPGGRGRAADLGAGRPGRRPPRPDGLDRRLLDLHAAARRGRRERGAAGRLRPAADRGRLLLQGRVPDRLRLRAGVRLPARGGRGARDRLPREGLPVVPLAHARPAEPPRAGLEGAELRRPRRRARRAAGVRRRRALVPAGLGRHRGLPRHGAAADFAAPPRAARRLRRPRGCERARLAARVRERRGRAAARGDAGGDARTEAARRPRPGRARAPGCDRRRRRDVRDARRGAALRVARALRLLDLGRRRLLPAARRDLGDTRRRPPAAEGGRRARARRGGGAPDGTPRGRRPGEARGRPVDPGRFLQRPVRRALRRPADE